MEVPSNGEHPQRPLESASTRGLVEELFEQLGLLAEERARKLRPRLKQASRGGFAAAMLATTGGALALVGGLILLLDVVYLLAFVMPLWVSGLIVGGATLMLGAVLAFGAAREVRKVVETSGELAGELREDAKWASQTVREARRSRRVDA